MNQMRISFMLSMCLSNAISALQVNMEPDVITVGTTDSLQQIVRQCYIACSIF